MNYGEQDRNNPMSPAHSNALNFGQAAHALE